MILYFNDTSIEVQENDSSYRYRSLMAKPQMVLKFSLPRYIEIPVGAYCDYMGERYYLHTPQTIKKNGTRNIEYTLNMGTLQDNMTLYKMRNSVDKRLKYSMHAKPHEFIEEIVANLNDRDGAGLWTVGTCVESNEKTIEFNHTNIDAALSQVAETFETEWEIVGTTIHLHKVEYFKEDPLPLSYGKGNGFVPGLGRSTPSNELPIKRLYVQGGDRNIDYSKYGSKELLLPKSQTLEYEGRTYKSDADGYYIERSDKSTDAVKEDSLDCSSHYPSRIGKVTAVEVVNVAKNFYDIIDNTIPAALNYNDYLIEGESMTIIFQSGMLAGDGKEFELKYKHSERRFEIVPQEIDGQTMPNETFKPKAWVFDASGNVVEEGDTYAIFGVMLPDAYICDNDTKEGASWDMFREAAKHLYENEDQKFTFTGTLQSLYAKRNWVNIGGKLIVGGFIHFSDEQFAPDGTDIRITGIKDYLTSPYSPTVEISNNVTGKSLTSKLREIDSQEVIIEENHKDALQFTRRRFRDAQENIVALNDLVNAGFDNFTSNINPISIQTMAMLVGDESLQFLFVTGLTEIQIDTTFQVTYDEETKRLTVPHSFLRHMTLGIDTIKRTHDVSEYKTWDMTAFQSAYLDKADKRYYLYAKVDTAVSNGEFLLSENTVGMDDVSGYYHLLVGILNSEYDGARSYVSLYGFTEILPARITTDKIVSNDGKTFFDLAAGKIGGFIDFQDGLISGLIELGNENGVNAGLSGEGNDDADIRLWAGASKDGKNTAPFRVQHNGKLYASDAEIEGKVTASEGSIGGFVITEDSISGGLNKRLSLGASPMIVDFQAMTSNKSVTVNGSPNEYVPLAYDFDYYENRKTKVTNSNPTKYNWNNISVIDVMDIDFFSNTTSKQNGDGRYYGYQYAMLGNGHICLDGIVEGNALDVMDVYTAHNQIHTLQMPLNSNRIAIQSAYTNDILVLPDILSLMSTIGVGIVSSGYKKCSFRIDIVNIGAKTIYIVGKSTLQVISGTTKTQPFYRDEYPNCYLYGELKDNSDAIPLYSNRRISILLIYTGSEYRAFIENYG